MQKRIDHAVNPGDQMTHRLRRYGVRVRGPVRGAARLRVIVLLASVLALNSADTGTIGAVAAPLEADLGISHTQLGLFATASAAVGALATPVAGTLADRTLRVRTMAVSIVLWSAALAAGGFARSYLWLLLSRLALGGAVATAGPVVASLIGDLFRPRDRGRAYSLVLTGEIVGAGLALVVGGNLAVAVSWRAPFFVLAGVGVVVAVALCRMLPEPERGGGSWLPSGIEHERDPGRSPTRDRAATTAAGDSAEPAPTVDRHALPVASGVTGVDDRPLRIDPDRMSLWAAGRYVLSVPTVRLLIIASAVGYFFFAGLRTFALVFAVHAYRLPTGVVTLSAVIIGVGALAGVLLGGRVADHGLRRGWTTVRLIVPAVGYAAAALLFLPGLLVSEAWAALVLFTLAAAFLASANPPLDAARLDIVPGALWGRAESVRTLLRLGAEAVAPVAFGFLADELGGSAGRAAGLRNAFLIMLVPLVANGLIVMLGRRTYPADVAAAAAAGRRPDG